MNRIFIISIFLIILSGCSATGPAFEPLPALTNDKATVYIYRPWKLFRGGGAPTVYLNGIESFHLKNNGYAVLQLTPGEYTIRTNEGSSLSMWDLKSITMTDTFEAKQEYYIKLDVEMTNFIPLPYGGYASGEGKFIFVSKESAMPEISKTKQVANLTL